MNFKYLILLIMFFLFGCGVKSNPISPPEKAISSYIDSYINPDPDLKSEDLKKSKK